MRRRKIRKKPSHRVSATKLVLALAATALACVQTLVFALPLAAGSTQAPSEVDSTKESSPSEEPTAASSEKDEFIASWAASIDAFDAGYPLEGYGETFAAAAYDYGVDPRLSPAIARVESGSGRTCAYPCNAWGWGTQSWSGWPDAIYGHVAGLASAYGTQLSWDMALVYCPEDPDTWYAQVEGCMAQMG